MVSPLSLSLLYLHIFKISLILSSPSFSSYYISIISLSPPYYIFISLSTLYYFLSYYHHHIMTVLLSLISYLHNHIISIKSYIIYHQYLSSLSYFISTRLLYLCLIFIFFHRRIIIPLI